jgi:hypothetical protein
MSFDARKDVRVTQDDMDSTTVGDLNSDGTALAVLWSRNEEEAITSSADSMSMVKTWKGETT